MLGEMISAVLFTRGVILISYAVQTHYFDISDGPRTLLNNMFTYCLELNTILRLLLLFEN